MQYNSPKGADMEDNKVGNNNTNAAYDSHPNEDIIQMLSQVQGQCNT